MLNIRFHRWYEYLGDAVENMYVPFPIIYTYGNETKAYNGSTKLCSEAYPVIIQYNFKTK